MTQTRLRGVWLSPVEGCPHRRGVHDWPDNCELSEHTCLLETGDVCTIFREIIEEWKKEAKIESVHLP